MSLPLSSARRRRILTGLGALLASLALAGAPAHASASVAGPSNPSTAADDASSGDIAWSNPGNVLASDSARAAASLYAARPMSHVLVASGFGLNVPSGEVIDGVTVTIQRFQGSASSLQDQFVGLTTGGTNEAQASAWPTAEATATYGGPTDTFGQSLTPAQVDDPTFGVRLQAVLPAGAPNSAARVNNIQVAVTYHDPAPAQPIYFPTGFWNQPLSDTAPIDPNSDVMVTDLAQQAAKNASMAVKHWNSRIYTAPAGTPKLPVVVDGPTQPIDTAHQKLQDMINANGGIPIPAGAQPSSMPRSSSEDTDSEIVVYEPSWDDGSGIGTGREWEFWHASSPEMNAPGAGPLPWGEASHGDSKWHVWWGGRISGLSQNPGYPINRGNDPTLDPDWEYHTYFATATSLPLLGGQVSFADWNAGVINHAMGLSVPVLHNKLFVWPAQRTDGGSTTAPIEEGQRFRLPANYPIDTSAPKLIQMMEQAAKTYGFVVWDKAGAVNVRFEQQQTGDPLSACPGASCSNLWLEDAASGGTGAFYDQSGGFVPPYQMGSLFPWSALQALTPTG